MGSKTFKRLARAKEFARARIAEGHEHVSIYPSGIERTKNYKVTVRYSR